MSDAPDRIHVRWGPLGAGVTYMQERFAPPSSAAEYVRADIVGEIHKLSNAAANDIVDYLNDDTGTC